MTAHTGTLARPRALRRTMLFVAATILGLSMVGGAQPGRHYPLETADGLRLHNVIAEPATLHGKEGTSGRGHGRGSPPDAGDDRRGTR
jgi:hypothetical protein